MAVPKSAKVDPQDPALKMEKNAGLIMGTNNSSIVSKRSVERLYHPEPHFFRYFVRKPLRRTPAINRGYWLRMRAIDHVVRQFLERPSHKKKLVINLGCGYDPLPFQWICREPDLCCNTRFIDIDYKELMEKKRDIILAEPRLKDALSARRPNESKHVLLDSDEYIGIGCDMIDIDVLDEAIKSNADPRNCLILCVAEVSLTYMVHSNADALIKWTASLSKDVKFCLLEQYLPDDPDHPFSTTMLKHFEKLQTPLRSILHYPSLHSQTQRFFSADFEIVKVGNLWDLWSDPQFLSPSQRLALDRVEPFDEWEEFALFASHYFLLTAQIDSNTSTELRRNSPLSEFRLPTRTTSPGNRQNHRYGLKYFGNPSERGRVHHGATYTNSNTGIVAMHGGLGLQTRRPSTDLYGALSGTSCTSEFPKLVAEPRSCHTITTFDTGQIFLAGGRASPAAAMQDCWMRSGAKWKRIEDMPSPRYRHNAAPVRLSDVSLGLLIFGGKNSSGSVHPNHLLWRPRSGWQRLQCLGALPTPRFGACATSVGDSRGLYFGGMRQDGVILDDFWEWKLVFRNDEVTGILFTSVLDLDVSSELCLYMGRFGATVNPMRQGLFVFGGIARYGCIPKHYEIMSISETVSVPTDLKTEKYQSLTVSAVPTHHHGVRPLLVGHASASVDEEVLIVGGGAVCFSFGTFWNSGTWLLHDICVETQKDWILLGTDDGVSPLPSEPAPSTVDVKKISHVERVRICSAGEFANMVKRAEPKIIHGLDFGRCKALWNIGYLKEKMGMNQKVVVHHAQSRSMNFQKKDFTYVTQTFGEFLEDMEKGAPRYLRSISCDQPAQKPAIFADDFPQIASDFHLPPELALVEETFYSSPLRISSGVNMWLHYDTTQNVLFQIGGSKKMVLFAPADMPLLDIPPGATTSCVEIFGQGGDLRHVDVIPGTRPVEAVLHPGDILFIPPLWAHTGAPWDGVNLAINVFFRNLTSSAYSSGRDVYSNRDLQAYENGRRDLDKIVRRFDESIPRDVARAYLNRLADELRMKAGGL